MHVAGHAFVGRKRKREMVERVFNTLPEYNQPAVRAEQGGADGGGWADAVRAERDVVVADGKQRGAEQGIGNRDGNWPRWG